MFEMIPYEKFRDTPSVRFFDITVPGSNARDMVVHAGPAISPPNDPVSGAWQFYLHPHQEDNLLAMHGGRTFYLVNLGWNYPFHIVRLESGGDILRIPPGTFHRSVSDPDGSLVLNQAVREEGQHRARIPRLQQQPHPQTVRCHLPNRAAAEVARGELVGPRPFGFTPRAGTTQGAPVQPRRRSIVASSLRRRPRQGWP